MSKIKSRYWVMIVYPSSAPDNWVQILNRTGLPIAISPKHDKDKNPDGSIKDPHYHVILCWDGPTTESVATEVAKSVNGTNAFRCLSVKGSYDYHCHLNDPDKEPYEEKDRTLLNGFDISNYSQLSNQEEIFLVQYITKFIKNNEIYEYCDLLDLLEGDDLQAYQYCMTHSIMMNTYITSRRNKIKSDGLKTK